MNDTLTILLTCCLGDYMRGTISCYKNNPEDRNVRIVGTDMNPMIYNFTGVDSFYQVSACTEPTYITEILGICKKENVDVVIPCNTKELEMFALNKDEFEKEGITVIVSSLTSLHIANDKIRSYEFFKAMNIPTPRTLVTRSYDEFKKFLDERCGITFCFKKRKDCGARGFRIIKNFSLNLNEKPSGVNIHHSELRGAFKDGEEYLIQEYLPGDEYTVDCVVDNGKPIASVCKINKDMENGVARSSEVIDNKECIDMCEMVCELLGLHGNIGFDLKCNSQGKPFIIDINPRLTATVSLASIAGLNLPWYAVRVAMGWGMSKIDATPAYGTKLVRKITDYFIVGKEGNDIEQ